MVPSVEMFKNDANPGKKVPECCSYPFGGLLCCRAAVLQSIQWNFEVGTRDAGLIFVDPPTVFLTLGILGIFSY